MMYEEFLKLAKTDENNITIETYDNVIEPMYKSMYTNTNLTKWDFVNMLNIDYIKENFFSPNNVEKEIVAVVEEMRRIADHDDTSEQENKFIKLAKMFCEMKGYEFGCIEYEEARNNARINTKFIAKIGNRYERYVVSDGKLVVSYVFFENLE